MARTRRSVSTLFLAIFALPGFAIPIFAQAADDSAALALKSREVFKAYCYRCHKGPGSKGGDFDVMAAKTLLKATENDSLPIVKGKSGDSEVYLRMVDKDDPMPPAKIKERPSESDLAVVKRWIDAGAPEPTLAERKPLTLSQKLEAIQEDLKKAEREDRLYLRYFTLTHLHNQPNVAASDLRTVRAALSKAINSLSWKRRIVVPRVVDEQQTILAIDVRDLDWDQTDQGEKSERWHCIMAAYPYGLRFGQHEALREMDENISQMTGCEMPMVRADWFIATATRPPLYHQILSIPDSAKTLEHQLGVDIPDNFQKDKLIRGAAFPSGISKQNRLIERHDTRVGSYWKSYDFLPDRDKANLKTHPLGPAFEGNPYGDQAFDHDGGEVIFTLPNGLQGYMLVDGKDQRIDVGPAKVVGDPLQTSGTTEIVNGISCMACHKNGMIRFTDQVRKGSAVFCDARRKVERLYVKQESMDRWLKEDSVRFMAALKKAIDPFLSPYAEAKPLEKLPDPIGQVSVLYTNSGVDLAVVTAELGLKSSQQFLSEIGKKKLVALGLGPISTGGKINRRQWETGKGMTLFQQTAREFNFTPFRYLSDCD